MAFSISYIYQAIDKYTPIAKKIALVNKKIADATKTMASKLTSAGNKLRGFKTRLSQVNQKLKGTLTSLRSVGASLSLRLTAPLGVFAGVALTASAKIETLQTSFESLLGSAEKAKDVVGDLINFTAKTPFQLEGVGKSAKQLLAFGVVQKELLPTLKQLGDIAAGANVPLSDIALIFGKAKSKGKLMTEELLQLSERGIPVIDLLAKRFNVTKNVIFEAASKSQISFGMMEDAFKELTSESGIFFDQMGKQSKTLAGIFSTFRDNVNLALAAVGDTLVETLDIKGLMNTVIIGIQMITTSIRGFAAEHPQLTKFLVVMTGIVAILGPLAAGIAVIALALGAAFAPIALITLGLAAVVAAGWVLADNWAEISDAIGGTIAVLVDQFTAFVDRVVGTFSAIPKAFGQIMDSVMESITVDFGNIEGRLKGVLPDFITKHLFDEKPVTQPTVDPSVIAGGRSRVDINMSLRDREGIIQNTNTRTSGAANFNLGRNM